MSTKKYTKGDALKETRCTIHIGFTESEYQEIMQALDGSGIMPGSFAKAATLAALGDLLKDGIIRVPRRRKSDGHTSTQPANQDPFRLLPGTKPETPVFEPRGEQFVPDAKNRKSQADK